MDDDGDKQRTLGSAVMMRYDDRQFQSNEVLILRLTRIISPDDDDDLPHAGSGPKSVARCGGADEKAPPDCD